LTSISEENFANIDHNKSVDQDNPKGSLIEK